MENQASKPHSEHRLALLEQARQAKTSPGVYLMKESSGQVLYVGKAKNLKNRLVTYFQSPVHDIPRIEMLVSRVNHFDLILTETEAEALILESTLIKKYKPKFNVRLKDDKAYPYLKIQIQEEFPRLEWTRRVVQDGARYFGPFPSSWIAREVMQLLTQTFKLRDCSDNTFSHRSRPCILFQMGKCSAPCVKLIEPQSYQDAIESVIQVLDGKSEALLNGLKTEMAQAAEHEEFEAAARFRDQIQNLELITQTQGVLEAGSVRSRDVMGISQKDSDAHGTLLRIRGGKLISVQHYHLQNGDASVSLPELLFDFISQYYLELKASLNSGEGSTVTMPSELLVPEVPQDLELLERVIELKILLPETSVDQQLIQVARVNAEYALEQNSKRQSGHSVQALEEIQEKLHLLHLPKRIECYDISNTQGDEAVASRVVFIEGAPDKNLYRRYKIKTIQGANDFAMMREVLQRRFSKKEEDLPDLIVVDGGKGQLSQAVAILDECCVQGVGVVGLAKARVEKDFKGKEVKSSSERIFIPNRKNPVHLDPHTESYKLLTHIRDEAHRFAITYHRLLRSKKSLKTEID